MFVRLSKTFTFEAAHFLPSFPEGHKCRRMHGHSFRVDVIVAGEVPEGEHHLVDYGDIKQAIAPVRSRLDHFCLNEVEGLENPTSEVLARWIFSRLAPQPPQLTEVHVHETCTSRCEYRAADQREPGA
jgi:6-pyruvoyltetrahydropterin/6-carboxytetrahydropterin synthase